MEQLAATLAPYNGNLRVWVDASLRRELSVDDRERLDEMIRSESVQQGFAGSEVDAVFLDWASRNNSYVVSLDLFRNYRSVHSFVSKSGRMFGPVLDPSVGLWSFFEKHVHKAKAPRTLEEVMKRRLV
jgi:hypothetical protein